MAETARERAAREGFVVLESKRGISAPWWGKVQRDGRLAVGAGDDEESAIQHAIDNWTTILQPPPAMATVRRDELEALVRAARDAEREIGGCTCGEAWTSRGLTDNINCRYHAVGDVEVEHLRAALVPFEDVAKEG